MIVREVVVSCSYGFQKAEQRLINRRCFPRNEDIAYLLTGHERIDGPASKIGIVLSNDATPGVEVQPTMHFAGVLLVGLRVAKKRLIEADGEAFRDYYDQLINRGLSIVRTDLGWESKELVRVLGVAATRLAPYRRPLERGSKIDRKTGIRWTPVYEYDETACRLIVEGRKDDQVTTAVVVREWPPIPIDLVLPFRKTRLANGTFQLLTRSGGELASVSTQLN